MSDSTGGGDLGGGIGVDGHVREVLTYCESNVLSPFDEGQVVIPDNGEFSNVDHLDLQQRVELKLELF